MKLSFRRVHIVVALALAIACFTGVYVAGALEIVSPPIDPNLWNPGFTTYPVPSGTNVVVDWYLVWLGFDSVTSEGGAAGGYSPAASHAPAPGYRHVPDGCVVLGVNAVYSGLTIAVPFDPALVDGDPADLRLFQWVDGAWKDITTDVAELEQLVGGSADPVGPDPLSEFSIQEPVAPAVNVPVYRFFRPSTGTHFYTSDAAEMQRIRDTMAATYTYEGVGYGINAANPANNAPLYRFYNKRNGTHLYTADEGEKNNILNTLGAIYSLDGVAYNVSMTEGTPVYRFFSPSKGVHFYSSDPTEIANVRANLGHIWTYEGPAYSVAQ